MLLKIHSILNKTMSAKDFYITLFISLFCLVSDVSADTGLPGKDGDQNQTAENRGYEIAKDAKNREKGFGSFSAELQMVLKNRYGEESTRLLRNKVLETKNDGDKTLLIIDHPKDIKGTVLLTHSHKSGQDDQWLYLPGLNRVKRVASRNRSGPFMGSEFAFEDLISTELDKYTYRYLKDEEINGIGHFVIERIPKDNKSGYTRQLVWYDSEELRIQKIDYYDRKKSLLKTLSYFDYKLYMNKYWRAHRMEMVNHQTGKSTVLHWADFDFTGGLSERDFSVNNLKFLK